MRRFINNRRRFCWASQLPSANDRLAAAVELVRERFFAAQVLIAMPDGELLAVEVCESGRRMAVCGRGGKRVTVAAGVFWRVVEAARKADGR
jgi:hypothetical protein